MGGMEHMVTANPAGYFEVLSGRSGRIYRVTPFDLGTAMCECPHFRFRSEPCSHIEAVKTFAANVLQQREAQRVNDVEQAHLQARFEDERITQERAMKVNVFHRIERASRYTSPIGGR